MQRPDTIDGLFHVGNPMTGEKGTAIPASWLNALLMIPTVYQGITEPPTADVGYDGDLYICTTMRTIYGPKAGGQWGDAWELGIPGLRGSRILFGLGAPGVLPGQTAGDIYIDIVSSEVWQLGNVWDIVGNIRGRAVLSGERDPLAADGLDGDWWINSATLTVYGPKAGGAWGGGQALRGPQGIQGAAGGALASVWADVITINQSMALAGYDVIYLGDTSAGALVWTAPTAVGKKGRQLYVENTGVAGNNLTLNGLDAETVEGSEGIDLVDGMGRRFYSDGANWRVMKG